MKKIFFLMGMGVLVTIGISHESISYVENPCLYDSLTELRPKKVHIQEAYAITQLLGKYHYKKIPLTDSISSLIFENYFDRLDPNRSNFFDSDIKQFESYRYELENQMAEGNLDFAYEVFNLYRSRYLDHIDYIFELLEQGFDFSKDEIYHFNRKEVLRPKNDSEQKEIWRKIIKNQAISYKLADKNWEDIVKSLKKRYLRIQKAIYQYNSNDVFQSYVNAFLDIYDPHTTYFSPPDAENFSIDMKLSFEGIGARLTQNLDYTQVLEVLPGGPAYKSKGLMKDDKIIGVAQGDKEEFTDVIGWRLDDVVSKIRGPKGSVVRLQLLKVSDGPNATPKTLRLIRETIKLEDQAARAEIIPISKENHMYQLGVITLPSFYIDWDAMRKRELNYKSSTKDVKKLINDLQSQGIDGLLIDLRYNGGGSLQEAIDMTGLFIPEGPVVAVKNHDNSIDKLNDEDSKTYYDGPLAVLVNRGSASASEIFSGAIQDYGRGLVVGEGTFGKGTVQNILDLNRYIDKQSLPTIANLKQKSIPGKMKITLAKFYRVTGSSNQKYGIMPDIQFPSLYVPEKVGEASYENALSWDQIDAMRFTPTDNISDDLLDHLNEIYQEDLNKEQSLKKLMSDIEKAKKYQNKKYVSLNIDTRILEKKNDQTQTELPPNTSINTNEVEPDDKLVKKLNKDPYLKESLRLLAAMKSFIDN